MKKIYPLILSFCRQLACYDISTYAASASFFIITSLFPMLMLLFSIVSYIPLAEEQILVEGIVHLLPDALLPFFLPITVSEPSRGALKQCLSLLSTFGR